MNSIAALPPQLSQHVFAKLFDVYSLLCCEVNMRGRIEQMWGNAKLLGLYEVSEITRFNQLPFLMGMPLNEPWVLEDTETAAGISCDIHFTPNLDDKNYLVFVPTINSIERRREIQQRSHDLAIAEKQQKKLIKELEIERSKFHIESNQKSQFIAGMSHEFRTPLTSIIGYTDLISEDTNLPAKIYDYLLSINRSSKHLLSLVENLLDQAQFEKDDFQLKEMNVSLENFMEEISAMIVPLAGDKGLAYHAQFSPNCQRFARFDGMRLRQVLVNILGNAIKFTDEGEVELILEQVGDKIVFTVTDTGPGISENDFEKIFSAFGRLEETKNIPGVGLGLNISARLVGLMGGTIDVDSTLGEGTSFIVAIPYVPADENYILHKTQDFVLPADIEEDRARSLLLVEDNQDISQLLSIMLMRSGYEVVIAENGKVGLDELADRKFDAIITDLNMPVMNGQDFVVAVRKQGLSLPVIALTASHKQNEFDKMVDLGFTEMLTKPILLPELLMALNIHVL